MIDAPKITQAAAQQTAMIHLTVPRSEIQNVMGPGLQELQAALDAQGIKATGPWFTRHLKMDPKIFRPIAASGRVKPGRLPAAKVARTVYHGGYEGLGAAWGEFGAWIKAQELTPAEDLWECYIAGPESGPDPAKWRTELSRPLRSKIAFSAAMLQPAQAATAAIAPHITFMPASIAFPARGRPSAARMQNVEPA